MWILAISILVIGLMMAMNKLFPREIQIEYIDRPVVLDNLSEKISELKGILMLDLKKCESGNHTEDDGLIVFDSNRVPSIGNYQFQINTVKLYYKKFFEQEITNKQAILIALDDNKAGELAAKIIFETEGGLSNWANCNKKAGLSQQLQVIKTISR
jgi:hypothetical protein